MFTVVEEQLFFEKIFPPPPHDARDLQENPSFESFQISGVYNDCFIWIKETEFS